MFQAPIHYIGDASMSDPDSLGLMSSSLTLHLPVDRKLSRGDIELRCQAALPGVPLPPRNATTRLPLRNDMQVINNQKLHWYVYQGKSTQSFIVRCCSMPVSCQIIESCSVRCCVLPLCWRLSYLFCVLDRLW